MVERTEEDKLTQAPLTVILGGEAYEIKPLVIRDARPWRAKVSELIGSLSGNLNATSDEPEQFQAGLNALIVQMPDAVIDLFFEYAKDLERQKIEAVATEAEIAKAFSQIMEVAFPLAQSLVGVGIGPRENRETRRKRP